VRSTMGRLLTPTAIGEDRIRLETDMGGMSGGGGNISVFEGDQATMYTLIPQMKQYLKSVGTMDDYMEDGAGLVFGAPEDADHPCQSEPDMTCEKIGSDTVLGRSVDKYLVKDVEDGVPTETFMWLDSELFFPLRIESEEGLTEATSLNISDQPDELFEVPVDYSEMQMHW